jgi:MoaA/NifB/PqqE/SkfB family radical SAM enzyme
MVLGTAPDEVARVMNLRYDTEKSRILDDFKDFKDQIFTIIDLPDLDPIHFLGLDREEPYSKEISAPYRIDLAITYKLPEGIDPEVAPIKRVDRELNTEEWIQIIDKVWGAGIPQIIFTGGEPTLRDDLPDLIRHAEENGQVTGLLTNGRKLSDPEYFDVILQSGLDHLMINMDIEDELTWKALDIILPEDIFTTVHLTISPDSAPFIPEIINKLSQIDVNAISLTSIGDQTDKHLQNARELVAELGLELVWDLAVPYSSRNPVTLEKEVVEHIDGAGKAWLYVEPDGDVLPAQGINEVLGNILRDNWDEIWAYK